MRRPWRLFPVALVGLTTTLTCLMLLWHLDAMQDQAFQIQRRARVQTMLGAMRANLESSLNRRLHLIRGLTAFVKANPDFSENEFHAFVSELGAELEGVRSLQLAPNAVVTHIHPLEGNEAAKGHDLLRDPERREAVRKAIDKKQFVIAGPLELIQGGKALIGRTPIFLAGGSGTKGGGERFWGLAILLIDFDVVLKESGLLDPASQLDIALRGKDGLGPQGAVFFGDPALFDRDAVILDITLPNGFWQIAGTFRHGWRENWVGREYFLLLGLLFSPLAGFLVFFLLRKPTLLQEALHQGEAQLRTLSTAIRAADTGVVITDRMGVIEWINPAFSEVTGYAPEEIIGRTHALLKSGLQSPAFYQSLWSTILEGRTWRGEFTNRHKDGHLYVDESVITPVLDANNHRVERFIAIKQDITRRRQEEVALQASHLRFRSLIQTARDAIIIANQDGCIEVWNRGAREIFGYEEEEALNRTIEFLMPEQYRNAHLQGLQRIQLQEEEEMRLHSRSLELSGLRKNGEEFPLELSLSHWKMGNNSFHLAIIRDLTYRKSIENQLKEYAERLEVMVRERTRQLLHTERLATLGTFSAGIAHEIKNPNSFISGNVAFLRQFWGVAAPILESAVADQPKSQVARFLKEVLPALEGVDKGSRRITTIVDSLKSYATGNRGSERRMALLTEPLEEASTLLQHRFRHGTQLTLEVPEDLALACNVQELSQVFINLFANAMDAMDEGGPETGRTIRVRAERVEEAHALRILVTDNGPGVPPGARATLFDPFFTTKGPTRGTGLGLSIVKGIIESHQGRIALLENDPPGATFEIILPTALASESA